MNLKEELQLHTKNNKDNQQRLKKEREEASLKLHKEQLVKLKQECKEKLIKTAKDGYNHCIIIKSVDTSAKAYIPEQCLPESLSALHYDLFRYFKEIEKLNVKLEQWENRYHDGDPGEICWGYSMIVHWSKND